MINAPDGSFAAFDLRGSRHVPSLALYVTSCEFSCLRHEWSMIHLHVTAFFR